MSNNKKIQQLLPWTNEELKNILKDIISHGTETSKVDFKLEIETSTQEQKAELLKDIIAISNSYDPNNYDDHGFLIFGVKSKTIEGITATETNTDNFQNHIEQLLKTYISPMPQIYVIGYIEEDGKKWGAIVIPPRNDKPYMFFKELQCTVDKTRSRKKGEWFVRRGTTTDVGLPEDLYKINQKQLEINLGPIKESIRSIQSRVSKVEEQYNSALFKLIERAIKSLPELEKKESDKDNIEESIEEVIGTDLPTKIKNRLKTPGDAIKEDLINEAKLILNYIEGSNTGLSWAIQLNNKPEIDKKIIDDIESKCRSLIISIATIIINDQKDIYTDTLIKIVKMLAKTQEIPSGTSCNRIGQSIRYYPLYLILYTIFICGVNSNKGLLLKKVLDIPLKDKKNQYQTSITDVYFYTYEAKSLFNNAYQQRWCEPVAQRVRQFINDNVGEMISELSEPEYFFKGEFVLVLNNISKCMTDGELEEHRVPLGGLYLYYHESNDPIIDFIMDYPEWFKTLYSNPVGEILDSFDKNASKMTGPGCFAIGIQGLKTKEAYGKAIQLKTKKLDK